MKPLAMIALLALCASAQAGQLYRWTDEEGRVHYTDQPPPKTAKTAEVKKLGDRPPDPNMPYPLKQAIKNYPVTLYNIDCGDVCTKASALLNKRGVPYTDRNAREDQAREALGKLTDGKLEVPTLVIGKQVLRGFEEGAWQAALDAAGYPRTGILPPREPTKQAQAPAAPAKPAPGAAPPPQAQQ
jgi:glutaredoxin